MAVEDINLGFLFLRALVTDKYGKINQRPKYRTYLSNSISSSINSGLDPNDALIEVFKDKKFHSTPNMELKYNDLKNYLKRYIDSPNALRILYNCLNIIGPITEEALERNKENTKTIIEQAKINAIESLKRNGDKAIENLITKWGDFSEEQSQIYKDSVGHELFERFENQLNKSAHPLDEKSNRYLSLSAVSLFHARCTQSGKGAAGRGLELAVQLILKHIGVTVDVGPIKITGGLEADLIVKKGGIAGNKLIVSCKTTARERYKQLMELKREELLDLNYCRIIWFFRECDLSEKQVRSIGRRGSIVYLPDNSSKYKSFITRDVKKYIQPLSTIRNTLSKFFDPEYGPET